MRRPLLLFLLLMMSSSCQREKAITGLPTDTMAGNRLIEEDHIREAVIRYQLIQFKGANLYFLCLTQGCDVSDKFLARFVAPPELRAASRAKRLAKTSKYPGYIDVRTGEHGTYIFVSEVKWLDRDEAQVGGGEYGGPLCAEGGYYTVNREDGKWVVVRYKQSWIS